METSTETVEFETIVSGIVEPVAIGTATFATRTQIFKAVASDAIGWVLPFFVAAAAVEFTPLAKFNLFIILFVWAMAFIISFAAFLSDVNSLARNGYTEGLRKRGLRVIDPVADVLIYKARLVRKSLFGVLVGRYEVIAL